MKYEEAANAEELVGIIGNALFATLIRDFYWWEFVVALGDFCFWLILLFFLLTGV